MAAGAICLAIASQASAADTKTPADATPARLAATNTAEGGVVARMGAVEVSVAKSRT